MRTKLFVANLHFDVTQSDLLEFFLEHQCFVKDVKIILDRATYKSRGFAFVEMEAPIDAERAVALSGEKLMGRALNIAYAKEKHAKTY